jgi:streptogrisin C
VSRSPIRSVLAATFAVAAALAITQSAGAATPDASTFTATQLQSVKTSLDQQWTKVPASVAGWYVDEKTHSVVVEVVGNDAAGLAFAKSGAGASRAVRTVSIASGYQPVWSLIGGQAIYFSSGRCSLGFNARNSAGTRYVITAGHCTNLGGTVRGVGGTIGPVVNSSFPGNDYGRIRVDSSAAVSTPYVDRYSSGSDVRVTGARSAAVGLAVCRSGSTTGWRCGSVTATNQTVCYPQGCVFQMIRTNVCAEPGDSGGSLVTRPASGSTLVQAVGLTSGGSGNCTSGGTTFFQPITEPLSVYGLTLFT